MRYSILGCGKIIEALEECHRSGMMHQVFGGCNNQKEALVECLHSQRMDVQKEHFLKAKEKRKAMLEKWKKLEEEEYGKDNYLKKVSEVKRAQRQAPQTPATTE